jgi:hypothetical protein
LFAEFLAFPSAIIDVAMSVKTHTTHQHQHRQGLLRVGAACTAWHHHHDDDRHHQHHNHHHHSIIISIIISIFPL